MRDWSFWNPVHIVAGAGSIGKLADLAGPGPVLLVTSKGFGLRGGIDRVRELLVDRPLHLIDEVSPNPQIDVLERQVQELAGMRVAAVIAIGGGSVLDTAKVLCAGLADQDFRLRAYLTEGVPIPPRRNLRLICVPTTAGTGSEVTPFATVWSDYESRKYSMSGVGMFPDVALLDPELTLSVSVDTTIHTGLDAITQAFEATWSRRANPVSTSYAVFAIRAGLETLPRLRHQLGDVVLRGAMLESSLLAGLAISHSRTALCHSISYPITARFGVPHGLACGFTLPEVFAFNRARYPDRFDRLAQETGYPDGGHLQSRLYELMDELEVGKLLRAYVGEGEDIASLAPEMLTPGRSDNNLREADVDDVRDIVDQAIRARLT